MRLEEIQTKDEFVNYAASHIGYHVVNLMFNHLGVRRRETPYLFDNILQGKSRNGS
jgi:hypothetical protein